MDSIKHGGGIYDAAKRWGISPYDVVDFSANINPLGTPPGLTECLEANWQAILHYPDPEYKELMYALSAYLGIDNAYIALGNGAIDLIYDYMRVIKPKRVLIPSPTFSEYKRAAYIAAAGVDIWPVGEDFALDADALCAALRSSDYDALVLCNPNNPTGALVTKDKIMVILDCARRYGVNVLLDETFIEFTDNYPDSSLMGQLNNYPNLFIVRAFTKSFAMPGLRLGYCLAGPELIKAIKAVQPPWYVNAMAAIAGTYVLKDGSRYMLQTRKFVKEQRQFLEQELVKLGCIKVYPSDANFVLIKSQLERLTADVMQRHLERYHILIRDASSFDGLDEHYVRLAVKDRQSEELLIKAISSPFFI